MLTLHSFPTDLVRPLVASGMVDVVFLRSINHPDVTSCVDEEPTTQRLTLVCVRQWMMHLPQLLEICWKRWIGTQGVHLPTEHCNEELW